MTAMLVVALALACSALTVVLAYAVLWLDRFRFEAMPGMLLCVIAGAAAAAAWMWWLDPALVHVLAGAEEDHVLSLLTGWLVAAAALSVQLVAIAVVSRGALFGGIGDGVLHGVAAGAGFAAVVNVRVAVETRPEVAVRALLQPLTVAIFCGAVLGFGVGRMKLQRGWGRQLGTLTLTMAIAAASGIALHAVYPPQLLEHTRSVAVLGWFEPIAWALGIAAIVWVAWLDDRRTIAAELEQEAALGVLPPDLVAGAASLLHRTRDGWWPDRDERRAINRLLTTLAFRRVAMRGLSEERARIYGLEVGRLRDRARQLLNPRPDQDGWPPVDE